MLMCAAFSPFMFRFSLIIIIIIIIIIKADKQAWEWVVALCLRWLSRSDPLYGLPYDSPAGDVISIEEVL